MKKANGRIIDASAVIGIALMVIFCYLMGVSGGLPSQLWGGAALLSGGVFVHAAAVRLRMLEKKQLKKASDK